MGQLVLSEKATEVLGGLGRIGGGSLDAVAGSLLSSFDFEHPDFSALFLHEQTGEPRN